MGQIRLVKGPDHPTRVDTRALQTAPGEAKGCTVKIALGEAGVAAIPTRLPGADSKCIIYHRAAAAARIEAEVC